MAKTQKSPSLPMPKIGQSISDGLKRLSQVRTNLGLEEITKDMANTADPVLLQSLIRQTFEQSIENLPNRIRLGQIFNELTRGLGTKAGGISVIYEFSKRARKACIPEAEITIAAQAIGDTSKNLLSNNGKGEKAHASTNPRSNTIEAGINPNIATIADVTAGDSTTANKK